MVWAPKSGAAGDRETRSRKGQSRTNAGCPRLRKLDIVVLMRIRSHDGSFDDSPRPAHRNRLMDPVLLHELHAAIEEIGHHRFAPAVTVAQAKHQARGALIAFGQQPLPMTVREATSVLGHRLDEIDADQPALAWEPLLRALQVLEREIAGGGGS